MSENIHNPASNQQNIVTLMPLRRCTTFARYCYRIAFFLGIVDPAFELRIQLPRRRGRPRILAGRYRDERALRRS